MKSSLTPLALVALFAGSPLLAQDGAVDFEKQVLPVLKESCFKCHEKEKEENGRVKKPKGGLRLDNADAIMKGGKEYPGENVVAGKPDASWLLKTMTLPESDEMAMPPEGKGDRVSAANQALIKKWIEGGAKFGAWKGVE
jgi:hypothetical protein